MLEVDVLDQHSTYSCSRFGLIITLAELEWKGMNSSFGSSGAPCLLLSFDIALNLIDCTCTCTGYRHVVDVLLATTLYFSHPFMSYYK